MKFENFPNKIPEGSEARSIEEEIDSYKTELDELVLEIKTHPEKKETLSGEIKSAWDRFADAQKRLRESDVSPEK